ncbi:transcriptional regulator, TetR family [Streptomyces sp. DvalAA-14]|uniref:TetR/AcrR family transcriptional regulator n=1 Tax=unclassified Streptomyces TaxID=2593676 RepID=UPI00081BA6FF|nr:MULTISPECIES: TetR/AcrR family transcriptional regulator [unclassified Streptomyces]MYS18896.1 TetR family transcriptional regulator [Streptomyces sp. SID4948]SCD31443.1 transcriptional regulator, TetR family [Streptomyces sp. DvalAA-14]
MDLVTDRAPKQDRSRATRLRVLEAAVACLAEHGWSGSTLAAVCARAGVSRGAAQHHFPTREELFTAAIAHVAEQWLTAVRDRARALPREGPDRTYAVVDMLVAVHTGPLFRAALHLWVTAAEEEALRPRVRSLESRIGRESHRLAVEFLGADESVPGVRETVQATLDMARGLGLANLLTDDSARRTRIVRRWSQILDAALYGPPGAG